jgi:hypothetical protein
MKLDDICEIGVNMEDANFWLQRRGTAENVGTPKKTFHSEDIGIKVKEEYLDKVLPDYLYYWFMSLHANGTFVKVSTGTLSLKNIRAEDIKRIPVSFT